MVKGGCPLTITRGVFFCCLLILLSNMRGLAHSELEITGGWQPSRAELQIVLDLETQFTDNHTLEGQLVWPILVGKDRALPRSNFKFIFADDLQLLGVYLRQPHYSSQDSFRMLHRDTYGQEGISLLYQRDRASFVYTHGLDGPAGIPTQLAFAEYSFFTGPTQWSTAISYYDSGYVWSLISSDDHWDFQRNRGSFLTMEAMVPIENQRIWLALGQMKYGQGIQGAEADISDSAVVIRGDFRQAQLRVQPSYRYIGPYFQWPIAQKNAYTRDRGCLSLQMDWHDDPWRIRFQAEQAWNTTRTRRYPRSELYTEYRTSDAILYWLSRWEPNQNLILGMRKGLWKGEIRMNIPQIRIDLDLKTHYLRLAYALAQRYRIEYRYTKNPTITLVYKLEPAKGRSFSYLSSRFGNERRWMEISYGESDRGQMAAKFDLIPSWRLSFGWRW